MQGGPVDSKKGLPLNWHFNIQQNELEVIRATYPQALIDLFGGADAIARIPTLNFEPNINSWPAQLTPEHLKGHKIMRGITDISYVDDQKLNTIKIPFVALCVKIKQLGVDIAEPTTLDVYVISKNHNNHLTLSFNGLSRHFRSNSEIHDRESIERIQKLLTAGITAAVDFDPNPNIAELTDQTEFALKAKSGLSLAGHKA